MTRTLCPMLFLQRNFVSHPDTKWPPISKSTAADVKVPMQIRRLTTRVTTPCTIHCFVSNNDSSNCHKQNRFRVTLIELQSPVQSSIQLPSLASPQPLPTEANYTILCLSQRLGHHAESQMYLIYSNYRSFCPLSITNIKIVPISSVAVCVGRCWLC